MRTPIIAGILSLLFGMASSEATAQDYLSDMAEWTFQKTCSPPVPAHESKPVSEPDASASDDTIVVTGTRVQHIDDTDLNGFIIHDPHLTLPPIHITFPKPSPDSRAASHLNSRGEHIGLHV